MGRRAVANRPKLGRTGAGRRSGSCTCPDPMPATGWEVAFSASIRPA